MGLAVGASADIFTLDADDPAIVARTTDTLLDSFVFAGARIDRVWRAGRCCVIGGRHIARERINARYRTTLERLLAS